MDLSFLMVFSKKKYFDPTGRQNFGDAPGQIPKLILTLCHITLERALFQFYDTEFSNESFLMVPSFCDQDVAKQAVQSCTGKITLNISLDIVRKK